MKKMNIATKICLGLFAIFVIGISVKINIKYFDRPTTFEDIYYIYLDGTRIVSGENPYSRIHDSDMKHNDKYPTYFPLFYYLAGLTSELFNSFESWLKAWRITNLLLHIGIGITIFFILNYHKMPVLGTFSLGFWLINRWTNYIVQAAHIDFLPILLLIISLTLFNKKRLLSLLLFGISLSIKQIAIFIFPLYIVWIYLEQKKITKELFLSIFWIGIIPFIFSLPFLIWDFKAFFKSILFSVTRLPATHINAPVIEAMLEWYGIGSKIPMLILMILIYVLSFLGHIKKYLGGFVIMLIFLSLNSVFFLQYVAWAIVFVPFVILEHCLLQKTKVTNYKTSC